ncbi:DIE2/ALG10 family-domain-containing protein [Pyrenochaeta sp. MPI-SDFR-AT-0127]|nr:DIE2/ALG10 family-domain-containing protein [Pyrenochaeta sp. MPI-SDFR-AT-0127]
MPSLLQAWAMPAALLAIVNISATWYQLVSHEVPEPYLDEYFHVPQAQKYCRLDYSWDPKITTPPGLYIITKFLKPLLGCDTSSLRVLNAGAICLICILCYGILQLSRARNSPTQSQRKKNDDEKTDNRPENQDSTILLDAHSALNIALFPPLFFFSALYYTDVLSTLFVLLNYSAYMKKSTIAGNIFENMNVISIGIIALLFRQTNIFWVAVFPAGLAIIDALKANGPPRDKSRAEGVTTVFQSSWREGVVYDCSVQDAEPRDYILLLLSVVMAALRKPLLVIQVVIPYAALLAAFGGFVLWNGSVVLGDKSAHTATIHLPQMLYVWPYIAFFSAPLVVGPLLGPLVPHLPKRLQLLCSSLNASREAVLPGVLVAVLFIVGSLIAIHFNTIIHPYTLADNRHYVFYVFRIFRQRPVLRYLAAPIYFFCAWLTVQALGPPSNRKADTTRKRGGRPTTDEADRQPCQISFIVIWLATTALSVITAPLVEPRYFIIPWIIWRLHVPYVPASLSKESVTGRVPYDMRLSLETVWLLAINAAVCYTFLYRGFTWPSEPGNTQRFIW